jgi:DNA-3-methyladenine glycosylase
MSWRIVETEAYVVGNASKGRQSAMPHCLELGHAYVYFIYGCWFSLNVSAGGSGIGSGVLLRGLEPLEGVDLMARHRSAARVQEMARGPGRLATALDITRELNGHDLCTGHGALWLGDAVRSRGRMGTSTRIGISRETDWLLRFFEKGNSYVSGPRHQRC